MPCVFVTSKAVLENNKNFSKFPMSPCATFNIPSSRNKKCIKWSGENILKCTYGSSSGFSLKKILSACILHGI